MIVRRMLLIALVVLVVHAGLGVYAHAADADKVFKTGGSAAAAGPETWAKLYPLPAYENGLTASG